ncbi:hypothetical protein [Dyadobacter sp. 676]|uniref:Tetratricopeptide repeat protein n=1 Tax=Dyadobacter sp. 676 TaxID=3088362 RepID=A0AAU8FG14_9BACT
MKFAIPALLIYFALLPVVRAQTADNAEIKRMYDEDQSARKVASIDWNQLNKDDALRRKRVAELLDSNKVVTGKDFYHGAMIFQHGTDTLASGMAIRLMKKAISLDTTINKWLLAAAIDRDLMRKGMPQVYGTQYVKMGPNARFERYKIDSTKITDEERRAYNVETLAEQKIKERRLNLLPISQYHATAKSVDETIAFIRAEVGKGEGSRYDVSEQGINTFGYQIIKTPEQAVKVFRLNTELYPEAFNTFDSYGECLMLLNRTDEAIPAYEKSLSLNPGNNGAREALAKLKAR